MSAVKDITIVGAGPVGLFAMFQSGLLSLTAQIVDAQPVVGGQCIEVYPEKNIYDVPGYSNIKSADLIGSLYHQASAFFSDNSYNLSFKVVSIEKKDGLFFLTSSNGSQVVSRTVILSVGNGTFEYNKLPLQGITNYEGRQILYSITKPEIFRDKIVTIVGAGDTAIDWALLLVDIARQVNLVHRRDKFRCLPSNQQKVFTLSQEGRIKLYTPYQAVAVSGESDLKSVSIQNINDSSNINIATDYLLPFFGMVPCMKYVEQWGVETINGRIIVMPNECKTNINGIYAVGDAVLYPNRHKLILTGFSEATFACYKILNQLKYTHNFTHSTSMSKLFESR